MDQRVQEILDNATTIQKRYVIARLTHPNVSRAANAIGLHRASPYNWDNLEELEEAAALMMTDVVEATKAALAARSLNAVVNIERVLKSKNYPAVVSAAKAIWDRIGLPAQSAVDVTSGGEPLKVQFTWHDPTDTDPNAKAAQPDPAADDHL
jgi:hypothetical protein